MSFNSEPDDHITDKVKVVLNLSNFPTKKELEHDASVDTSTNWILINWLMFYYFELCKK